jgi:DNA topoisomerase-1
MSGKTLNEQKAYESSRRPTDRSKTRLVAPADRLRTPSGTKVPPAWTDVWITTDVASRIQATGRDAAGRRVYLYSTEYVGREAAAKFARLQAFSKAYPRLGRRIRRDLGSSEEARVLYLISKTGFRIGDKSETLAQVKAYGASTLRCSHVTVDGEIVSFDFTGKKGIRNAKTLRDKFLATEIGNRCSIGSDKNIFKTSADSVRAYLDSISGRPRFLVKDFRTYLGTMTALRKIKAMPVPKSQREFKRFRKEVGEVVAKTLGNTPTIALKSYVSPEVFAAWECGHPAFEKATAGELAACVCYDKDVPAGECRDSDPLEKSA